jgi:hypothetical protein
MNDVTQAMAWNSVIFTAHLVGMKLRRLQWTSSVVCIVDTEMHTEFERATLLGVPKEIEDW